MESKRKWDIKEGIEKNKRTIYLVVAILCFVTGLVISYIGNMVGASPVILFGFIFMVVGVVFFIMRRRMGSVRYVGPEDQKEITEGDKRTKIIPNCLVIYPDRIAFEYVAMPPGLSQKCLNDNKFYHVLKYDPNKQVVAGFSGLFNSMAAVSGKLVEFKLPDDDENERYYDPGEFANPVTMPSNKKYFTWSISTMQKISVGIMAICIAGMLVGIVALGG